LLALCALNGAAAAPENPLLEEVKVILNPSGLTRDAVPEPLPAPKLFDFVKRPALERTRVETLPTTAPLTSPPWQENPRPPGTLVPDASDTVTCERPFVLTEAMRSNPWEVRIAPELTYDARTFEVQSVLIGKEAQAMINGQFIQVGGTELEPFSFVMIRSSEVILQYGTFKLAVPEGRPVTVRTARK
jgi:hypothetical protein